MFINKAHTTLLLVSLVTACGGGGGGSSTIPPMIDPPPPAGSSALLLPAGSNEVFTNYMQSSLRLWGGLEPESETLQTTSQSPFTATTLDLGAPVSEDAVAATAFGTNASITSTNLLVSGVDEIDATKYSGDYLYLANGQHLSIVHAPQSGEMNQVADLRLIDAEDFDQVRGIYHHQESATIAALTGGSFGFFAELSILPYYGDGTTSVKLTNVANPASPTVTSELTLDGNLLQSRRIDDVLYLVTEFTPFIDGYEYFASTDETQSNNQTLLEETNPEELLPTYTLNGTTNTLADPAECLLPNESDDTQARYPSMINITRVQIDTGEVLSSTCMLDGVIGIHMTESTLYVASPGRVSDSYFNSTTIHNFSLESDSASYVASGTVDGSFWGDPAFLMGESNDNLIVITTETSANNNDFEHRLTVLDTNTNDEQLPVLATIPNPQRPEAIGKPGEQIFASRILNDRAYIVTFERIDPVYAIDLSNSSDPLILGELEIPGFSSYLHPIADDLFLGIGTNTTEEDGFIVADGVNVRLFNVADPGNVELLDEMSFGRSWSSTPVAFDYHAFTSWSTEENEFQFAFPLNRYGSHLTEAELTAARFAPWTDTTLQLLSIPDVSSPQLHYDGEITAEDHGTGERYQPGCCTWSPRSFFNSDRIYYLNRNRLFTASRASLQTVNNHFIETVFTDVPDTVCSEFVPEPLSIAPFDRVSGDYLSCGGFIATDSEDESDNGIDSCNEPVATVTPEIAGPGSYSAEVMVSGYETQIFDDVRLQMNNCHLGSTHLSVYLERQEE